VRGPGDRASKTTRPCAPTLSPQADGHDGDPINADWESSCTPGSKSSASAQLPLAREPGDLGVASLCVVHTGLPREGQLPYAVDVRAEESDAGMVPMNSSKTWVTPVEAREGRAAAEGKSVARNASPTQRGIDATTSLQRIGNRAKNKPKEQWTNLLSHIRVPLLEQAFHRLRRDAAPGVDAMTWETYGERLGERLRDLEDRIHRGSYHPLPVRRVQIPKGLSETRPIGIAALEDKLVQQAVRSVLEPIYEAQFVGFSYGFRPGRSPHDALDALAGAIARKVNWVLDADIRSFFDTIDHGWMQRFFEHRIGDTRMVRLLMKWLRAGVMENGQRHESEQGTAQGGIISPLMANVYLHYVFDLWAQSWRKTQARGAVYLVRYADDIVMGFQCEQDARAMYAALTARLAKFGLTLHPDKSRVLRFGRFAAADRRERGLGKPETFEFLGFTHIASESRGGKFQLKRRTSRKKRAAKQSSLAGEMRRRMHASVAEQHEWLSRVLEGHYRYYGVPTNMRALSQFRRRVEEMWHRSLQRRSQRAKWSDATRRAHQARFSLPVPWIHHPWPDRRFDSR